MSRRWMTSVPGMLMVVFLLCPARLVAAECIGSTPRELRRMSARVVDGTVRAVSDDTAHRITITIDVHRLWKGPQEREMVVYVERVVGNQIPKPGDRRVFFAITEATLYARPESPSDVLLLGCSSMWPLSRDVTAQLGRARLVRTADPQIPRPDTISDANYHL